MTHININIASFTNVWLLSFLAATTTDQKIRKKKKCIKLWERENIFN